MLNDIWLAGRMGSGKSTIARALRDNYDFVILPLAYALKSDIALAHGITIDALNADKGRYRSQLQAHGEAMRQDNPRYWVERWQSQRDSLARLGVERVVVDDCRYVNEAEYAQANGGVVAKVLVPDAVRRQRLEACYGRLPSDAELNHASESDFDRLPVDHYCSGVVDTERVARDILSWIAV